MGSTDPIHPPAPWLRAEGDSAAILQEKSRNAEEQVLRGDDQRCLLLKMVMYG